jgi:ABC-type transport system involved in multi-copper enzyme maturation permease subunit
MSGILIKDLYNLKGQLKIAGVILLVYGIITLQSDNYSMLSVMTGVFGMMLPVTACAYDEKAKWDRMALSMPLSRRDLAFGKYLLGTGLATAGLLINLIVLFIIGVEQVPGGMGFPLGVFAATLIFLALLLPIIFHFGVEKGRMYMLALFLIPTVLILLLQGRELPAIPDGSLGMLKLLIPLLVVVMLAGSLRISAGIMDRKEY